MSYSLSRDLSLFGGYRFTRSIYDVTGIEVDGGRTGSSLINDHSFRGGITLKFW